MICVLPVFGPLCLCRFFPLLFVAFCSLLILCAFGLCQTHQKRQTREREREREAERELFSFFIFSLKEKSNGVFEVREQSRNFAAETLHLFPNKKKNKSSSSSSFFAFCCTRFFGALERMVDWMTVLLLLHAFGSLTECRSKIV
jgi:hypothetical protein